MLNRPNGIIPELQSRIAKRRNYISKLEDDIILFKAAGHKHIAYRVRQHCTKMAVSQKLDKDLLEAMCAARTLFTAMLETGASVRLVGA